MGSLAIIVFNLIADQRLSQITMLISICWLVIAIAGFVMEFASIVTTSLILGVIGIIITIWITKTRPKTIEGLEGIE